MRYSDFTKRIGGDSVDAWQVLYKGLERQQAGEDVIVLALGDPDFDTPQPIIDATFNSLNNGDTHYGDVSGDIELRDIIANWHTKTTGLAVNNKQVVVMNGAQCALYATAQCLLGPGDEIIIPEPMYTTYDAVFNSTGAKIVRIPMRPDNGFQVMPEDIAAAITSKTRAILLNSPNNPSGAIFPRQTMEAVAKLCIEHDLWLISDEVYSTLTYEQAHFSPCSLRGMAERTVTINSLSKSHAMTGWRVGWAVCPEELAVHLANVALCMLFGNPVFIQAAAKVALTQALPELELMKQTYKHRRDTLYALLKDVEGLEVHLPEAGMFLMLDIRSTGLSSQAFATILLDKFDVATLPCGAFGPSVEGYVRLSLSVPVETLVKAGRQIDDCMKYVLSSSDAQQNEPHLELLS
ncbi:L-aspartate aminotransferase apoenzyme [Colwellia chukchiensis]|uniref:Aminotransferase n=1 Tax=Colwellia chukchiensis TaxID=641665 RepID=A0A1H7GVY7_9GAMM|nr:aminotransferase class I/II-fold pyridoxal phosphate-dependent enzyme [Colwellia chukchiensis]SEK42169.1 L-aspartate aminotransferase apoenzyme [Colwellia chukchiensis]